MTAKPPRHLATLVALLVLTAVTASISSGHPAWLPAAVLTIAFVKMMLVAFRFMDLRSAHLFWKGSVVIVTCAFLGALRLLAVR